MSNTRKRQRKPLANPIAEYAKDLSLSPAMRAIAQAAESRGLRQEALARAYAEKTGRRTTGSNVFRHFTMRPQRATIETYAAIVGLPSEYLRLLEGQRLSEAEYAKWHNVIAADIWELEEYYDLDTVRKIVGALEKLDNVKQDKLVDSYIIAFYTHRPTDPASGWPPSMRSETRGLLEVLRPLLNFDVKAKLRTRTEGEDFLYWIWSAMWRSPHFTSDEAEATLNDFRARLKAKGIDPSPMDEFLQAQWRALDRYSRIDRKASQ
jgi:hypothetical protein